MKLIIQIILFLTYLINNILCQKSSLFLDQEVHEIDPFSLEDGDVSQEYNHLNFTRSKQYLVVENIDKQEKRYCWSFFLDDFIDLDVETENRFVRVFFQKLNFISSFNVIGLESLEHNKFKRIFLHQDGKIGYAYQDQKLLTSQDEKVYLASSINKEHTFKWSQGDIIQIFYFAEEKSIIIYNQSRDNLFKFNENLITTLGRKFKIFIGISSYQDQVVLSNYLP